MLSTLSPLSAIEPESNCATWETLAHIVFGLVIGVILDWLVREPVVERLHRYSLRRRQRRLEKWWHGHSGTVRLGTRNTQVLIIDGNGAIEYKPRNIKCSYDATYILVPPGLAEDIKRIEVEQRQRTEEGKAAAWDGDIAHITTFSVERTPNEEDVILRLRLQKAKYFHFMATNAVLWAEYRKNGMLSATRSRFLGAFKDWATTSPPMLVNGLPINLLIVTLDKKLVFSKRSDNVAIGPNSWACPINENIHPDYDRVQSEPRLDVGNLLTRSLAEEIGWKDDEHTGTRADPKAEIHLLAFGVHTGDGGYGLIGYAELPITFKHLQDLFAKRPKDKIETAGLVPVDLGLAPVCYAIHGNGLYDIVGVAALYTLLHLGFGINAINRCFVEQQEHGRGLG